MLHKQYVSHSFLHRFNRTLLFFISCIFLFGTDSSARTRRAPGRPPLPRVTRTPQPPAIDPAAKIALARARQLAAAQADELAVTEFERAAALAPRWVEAQRELALWRSSHEEWEPAAIAWSRVLTLLHDKHSKEYLEATAALEQARSNLPAGWTSPQPTPQATPQATPQPKPTPVKPVKPVAAKPSRKHTPQVAAAKPAKPPRLTQVPRRSGPALPGPSGSASKPITSLQPPASPIPPRLAKAFPLKSTPSLTPRRSTPPPAVAPPSPAPRVAAAPSTGNHPTAKPAVKKLGVKKVVKSTAVAGPLMNRAARALQSKHYEAALKLYQKALAAHPKNQQAQQGVTQSLLLLKRYDVIEAAARRVLAFRPDDIPSLHNVAAVLMARKDTAGALRIYQQVLGINPDDFTAAYQIARILTWGRRYDAAEPYYRQALALQPSNPEVWAAWGESLTFTHDTRGRGAFERALQLRPGYMRAILGLANLFMADADYENALKTFKAALTAEPRNVAALVCVGDVMTYSNQESAALPYYQKALRIAPKSASAHLSLGRALIYTQQYQQGIPHLGTVLKTAPDNEEAVQLLAFARTYASARGEVEAIAAYRALLKRQPELSHQALTWAAIGQLKTRQGDLAGAREAYAVARRMAPGDSAIILAYAQSFIYQDQWSEAAALVEDVLRREPENLYGLILQFIIASRTGKEDRTGTLASQLVIVGAQETVSLQDSVQTVRALRQAGHQEAARQVWERLGARSAADISRLIQIADAARTLGDNEAALVFYGRVPETDPRYEEIRLKLIETLIEARQYDAARKEIATALARGKNNPRLRTLSTLNELRSGTNEGWESAKKQVDELLTAFPKDASIYVLAGDVMSARNFYAAALDSYRTALTMAPDNLQAQLGLVRSLYALRRTDEALEQYQELIRRAPGDARLKLECAQIYLEQGKLPDAGLLFNQVLAMSRSFLPPVTIHLEPVAARKYAAEVAACSNTRLSALSTASTARAQNMDSPLTEQVLALRGMGEIRGRQQRFADATNYFRRALQLEPTDVTARLSLAQSLRSSGDRAASQAEVEQVLAADAGNITARALRAQLLLDGGKAGEAETELNNLIAALPAKPALAMYLSLYQSFKDWRNFSTALRFLEMARQSYPEKPDLARLTGETLAADNQWDKALEAFDQALAANPGDISTLLAKARIYAATNRLAQAESLYRRAADAQKDNNAALVGLAGVLSRQGKWADAVDVYRTNMRQNADDVKTRVGLAHALRYQLLISPSSSADDQTDLAELVDLFSDGSKTKPFNARSAVGLDLWP